MSCSHLSLQCQSALCKTPWSLGNTASNQEVRQQFCVTGFSGYSDCGTCTKYYGSTCCGSADFASCFVDLQRDGNNCGTPGPGNTLSGGMSPPPPTGTSSSSWGNKTTSLSTSTVVIVPPPISVVSLSTSLSIIVPPLNVTTSPVPTSSPMVTTVTSQVTTVVPPPVTSTPSTTESVAPTSSSPATSSSIPSTQNTASATGPSLVSVLMGAGAFALLGLGGVLNYI